VVVLQLYIASMSSYYLYLHIFLDLALPKIIFVLHHCLASLFTCKNLKMRTNYIVNFCIFSFETKTKLFFVFYYERKA
jgi:hypothetical protein